MNGNWLVRNIILICFLCASGLFLWRSWVGLSEHRQLEYGEGPILDQVERLSDGENIYRPDLTASPFVISNYPPVFQLSQLPLRLFLGPGFLPGRLLSCIAILGVGFCLWNLNRRLGVEAWGALASSALFLSNPFILEWGVLNRVDSLALFWSGLTVVLATGYPFSERRALSIVLFTAFAVFTRQSYIVSLPPLIFWLLHSLHGAQFARLYLVRLLMLLAIGGVTLYIYSQGGAITHLILANMNPFQASRLLIAGRELLLHLPVLVIVGVLYTFKGILPNTSNTSQRLSIVRSLLLASIVAALAAGKIGSSYNYFFEFVFASSIGVAVAASPSFAGAKLSRIISVMLILQLSMNLWSGVHNKTLDPRYLKELGYFDIWDTLENTSGPILTDEFMGIEPMSHRRLSFQPFEMTQLFHADLWSQIPLLQQIRSKHFDQIVIRSRPHQVRDARWTTEMLEAIQSSYILLPHDKNAMFLVYIKPGADPHAS